MKKRTDLLLRSLLFVPGFNERYLQKAITSEADAIIIDLEDSVSPPLKPVARSVAAKFLPDITNKPVFIRINDRNSNLQQKDITALCLKNVTGFMLPKIYNKDDILYFEELILKAEKEFGFPDGFFKLIPLIETAAAVLNAYSICAASSRIIAIAFGSEDYLAEVEAYHAKGEPAMLFARSQIVVAARASGVLPLDTLHINVHDLVELEEELTLSRVLGFEGRLLLHPKEIPFVHQYYSPTPEEVKKAASTIEISNQSSTSGKQVAYVKEEFVGPPLKRLAKKIIIKNNKIKNKEKNGKKYLSNTI